MGAYDKIAFRGHTMNRRSVALYLQAEHIYRMMGGTGYFDLLQGSYSTNVAVSGNTHKGGGAHDSRPTIKTAANWRKMEKAFRLCMWADWDRPELYRNGKRLWGHHNHGILIGDKQMSTEASWQIRDYHMGQDGLAGTNYDPRTKFRPNVIFTPSYPLGIVDLSVVMAQYRKKSGWTATKSVKLMQTAMNLKIGAGLYADGIFGPKTKSAYLHYERVLQGRETADGQPGAFSLTILGAGRFNVRA